MQPREFDVKLLTYIYDSAFHYEHKLLILIIFGINPKCCGGTIKNLVLRFLPTYVYDLRYCILTETIFPDFILDHFEFKGVIVDNETFNIELEEINNPYLNGMVKYYKFLVGSPVVPRCSLFGKHQTTT